MDKPAPWISASFIEDLVSVIIPTYNRSNLLHKAIQSVFEQTYRPIEIIVVDDGSSEDISLVIKEFMLSTNNDISINLIKQTNAGAPVARNNGTISSTGEFIQYLDSDDMLDSEKIKKQVDFLNENPVYDGVFGNWQQGIPSSYKYIKAFKSESLLTQFYGGRVIANFSFLFRRSIINQIGPWDETLKRNQEIDFNLRGVLVGGQFDYIDHNTGLWRDHDGERIVTNSGVKSVIEFHNKWIDYFEKRSIFTSELKELAANYLFWSVLTLKPQISAFKYLLKVNKLNPDFKEFNTRKMSLLKRVAGPNIPIILWYIFFLLKKT